MDLIKKTCLLKFFRRTQILKNPVSLSAFPATAILTRHNISIISEMVKKVINLLDCFMASGPDCIPMVFSKDQ